MGARVLTKAALMSAAGFVALAAPLRAPEHPAPTPSDISALFDPLEIARAMCGPDAGPRLSPFVQAALATPEPAGKETLRSPMFEGLGPLTYKITTASPKAQAFFDQGLKLFYAFNPGEAVASFRAASDADPTCAMCYWGEALVLGPNMNGQKEDTPGALAAIAKAKQYAPGAMPREQALIQAVEARFSADKDAKRDDLNLGYAEAMAKAHAAFPDDNEIAAVYAEAAMNIHSAPWGRWWDKTGRYPTSYLADAIKTIEGVLARDPNHPGAIHLYIHAMDGAADIAKVEPYADRLARLMPNAGHMVHMPAHTFFNIGRYKDALATNLAAIAVDDTYLKGAAAATTVYRYGLYQHNVHFAITAADMAGDAATALRMAALMNDFHKNNSGDKFEMSGASALHPVVRFGAPEDMLALPKPGKDHPYILGVWHFARGSAYAYQKNTRRALEEADEIENLTEGRKPKVKGPLADLLGVAAEVVRGRTAAAEGKWQDAADHFEKAVGFQDKVTYRDPPFWDFPVRQAQGVALYRAGKLRQAAETLRQALIEAPNSGYALYALKEVSAAMGDQLAATEYGKLFEKAWAGTKPPELDRL